MSSTRTDSKLFGLLVEFETPAALLKAAEKVRDAGYKKFDCHSPFPIHGMDQAMGMKRSNLGYLIAIFTIIGAAAGLGLQYWVHSIEYPHIISGKPLFAWQAYIVVMFAMFVLFGAGAAVFGMLHINRLPRLHHPVFFSDRFSKVTTDGFFISLEAADPQFDLQKTEAFLREIGGAYIERLEEK
ncbi:MAG: DUF3341 domain-containing protein [FCB group bacterium]|nr:DUF3341 domain-containing protein [FCB group bacterium]